MAARRYFPVEACLSPIRRNRRWLTHLFSFALLFAQLGLTVHASSHLRSDLDAAPAGGQQLCGECCSFTPLQNLASGALTVILPVATVTDFALDGGTFVAAPPRAFAAFRSRAPPTFL